MTRGRGFWKGDMDDEALRDQGIRRFLRGELSAADRAAFKADMVADKTLAAEVAMAKAVMLAVEKDVSDATETEDDWRRISDDIDGFGMTAAVNDNRAPGRFTAMTFARAAAVAIGAVFIWEVVASPYLRPETGDLYTTATETRDLPALQVIFAQDATAGSVTALMKDVDATISGGPSALGVYEISFKSEAARDEALKRLSEETGRIRSVSPR